MSSVEPKVIAIISRSSEGELEQIYGNVKLNKGDTVLILPVTRGVVIVVGALYK